MENNLVQNNNENYQSVTEINRYIGYLFDNDLSLQQVYVEGELSNVKKSGQHYYFSLKDQFSEISGMFFYPLNRTLKFIPKDGDKVQVIGRINVYQKRGTYSINVQRMNQVGIGLLYEQFLELKAKLEQEGLFQISKRFTLPAYPSCVGIITAESGEAINDIVSTFNRRFPLTKLKLYPSLVQGIDCPKDLIKNLYQAYQDPELDCIIIGRGGGSFEDLNGFNDEALARMLAKAPIPTVSAVGHEGDYTICDFVCSFRAPTPTGAAMMLTKVKEEVFNQITDYQIRLKNAVVNKITNEYKTYKNLTDKFVLLTPENLANKLEEKINTLTDNLNKQINNILDYKSLQIDNINLRFKPELVLNKINNLEDNYNHLIEKIILLNPLNIINKGYAVVYNQNKEVVSSTEQVNLNDQIDVRLKDGMLNVTVNNKSKI